MISIVDDDNSMRDMLVSLLRSFGYDARAFASAEEFLAADDLEKFTCTITDIHMPGMSGFELKERLDELNGSMPVIMITARTEAHVEDRALQVAPSVSSTSLLKPKRLSAALGRLWENKWVIKWSGMTIYCRAAGIVK